MAERYWEEILEKEGLPADLPNNDEIPLGDGLGMISTAEDAAEDDGVDSSMCPLNLGYSIGDTHIDRPGDRPTEYEALNGLDEKK